MDPGSLFIIIFRLIIPITILRYPVGGFFLACLLDGIHVPVVETVNQLAGFQEQAFAGWQNYYLIDKWLDIYFLSFALATVFKWQWSAVKKISLALWLLRLIGTIVFSLTSLRCALFFFPNIFEFFYIYLAICRKWFKKIFPNTKAKLVILLIFLMALKMFFEYFMHIKEWGLGIMINNLTPLQISAPTLWEWLKSMLK